MTTHDAPDGLESTAVEPLAETATRRLTARLREAILSGSLQSGDRIKIAELAARYGISHMPVREALRQLEGERLVVIHPHRGAVIRQADVKFIDNMYQIRAAIEGLLVSRCADRIRHTDIRRLEQLEAAHVAAAKTGETRASLDANARFHGLIYQIADNEEARRILTQGWELISTLRLRFGFGPGRLHQMVIDHAALVSALAARDKSGATVIAIRHSETARDDLLERMRASAPTAPGPATGEDATR